MTGGEGRRVVLGRVSGVFGVKGWVKVWSFTDPPEGILSYRDWQLGLPGGWEEHRVDAGQRQGKGLVAHLAGCDDRDLARRFVQADIAVSAESLPQLPEGEYYWYQLEGLDVIAARGDGTRVLLGKVDHLFATGANDVVAVRPAPGSVDERERLLPWVDGKVILGVDLAAGELLVDWDPGY